jgi:thiosulfate dehydrogenase (quinone) large subunit
MTHTTNPASAEVGRLEQSSTPAAGGFGAAIWAVTRVALGFVFLWAFLDKLIGLGKATPSERAWVNGGSPTTGYLSNVDGPFSGFFSGMAGQAWADWLFMAGLLGIGVALILGIGMWIAAISGALLLTLMWLASLPIANNPFLDDHLVYGLVLLGLAATGVGLRFSLAGWWRNLPMVRQNHWLR